MLPKCREKLIKYLSVFGGGVFFVCFFLFDPVVVCWAMENSIVALGNIWETAMSCNILVGCRFEDLSSVSGLSCYLEINFSLTFEDKLI